MKRIFFIIVAVLSAFIIVSCEKDFRELGGNIISNNSFNTKQIVLDVVINKDLPNEGIDISSVRADNIAINTLGEYLLGVYKNDDYKKIEASIVSQLGLPANLPTSGINSTDTTEHYILDKVALIFPYEATNNGQDSEGKFEYSLDSVLGDNSIGVPLKVLRNETFLNTLDPGMPSQNNSFLSNHSYTEGELLNEDPNFQFIPRSNDSILVVRRELSTGSKFNDTIKLQNSRPFLSIPLDKSKMKQLFWDKFSDSEFSSQDLLNNYFKGLIIKAEGTDGAMVPLNFAFTSNNIVPSLNFYYTVTRVIKGSVKDTLKLNHSFTLSGVVNSKYVASPTANPAPTNSFKVQGTAGTMAKIEILNDSELQDLRSQNILINDASLIFNIDSSRDTVNVPKRLFAYKKEVLSNDSDVTGNHIKDNYSEAASFGGSLLLEDNKPNRYTFKITDYISDLVSGESNDLRPLLLKVYNQTTDDPITNRSLDTIVKNYNWNPRGVTLLNNSSTNGALKARLVISYSEEK